MHNKKSKQQAGQHSERSKRQAKQHAKDAKLRAEKDPENAAHLLFLYQCRQLYQNVSNERRRLRDRLRLEGGRTVNRGIVFEQCRGRTDWSQTPTLAMCSEFAVLTPYNTHLRSAPSLPSSSLWRTYAQCAPHPCLQSLTDISYSQEVEHRRR
jgi:hypothetical protein